MILNKRKRYEQERKQQLFELKLDELTCNIHKLSNRFDDIEEKFKVLAFNFEELRKIVEEHIR